MPVGHAARPSEEAVRDAGRGESCWLSGSACGNPAAAASLARQGQHLEQRAHLHRAESAVRRRHRSRGSFGRCTFQALGAHGECRVREERALGDRAEHARAVALRGRRQAPRNRHGRRDRPRPARPAGRRSVRASPPARCRRAASPHSRNRRSARRRPACAIAGDIFARARHAAARFRQTAPSGAFATWPAQESPRRLGAGAKTKVVAFAP